MRPPDSLWLMGCRLGPASQHNVTADAWLLSAARVDDEVTRGARWTEKLTDVPQGGKERGEAHA